MFNKPITSRFVKKVVQCIRTILAYLFTESLEVHVDAKAAFRIILNINIDMP